MQETWVWFLGWGYSLEKEMVAHSNILAWKILWTAEPGRLLSMGSLRVGHDWVTSLSLSLYALSFSCIWLLATPWTVDCQAPLSMGILQARILEWVAMSSSRGSSQPRDWTQISHIAGRLLRRGISKSSLLTSYIKLFHLHGIFNA